MEFNSIQDFKSNYTHVYHKEVVPLLAPYEKERRKTKRNFNFLTIIVLILFALLEFFWYFGRKFSKNACVISIYGTNSHLYFLYELDDQKL